MTLLAMLPMYDWPEVHGDADALLARLRRDVPELPDTLTRPDSQSGIEHTWRDPGLLLGQSCWGPLDAGLVTQVRILAQPSYHDIPGGRGMHYRSAIVMRDGAACSPPHDPGARLPARLPAGARFAINQRSSLSGALALAHDLADPGLIDDALVTGSHRESIRAVADGRADVAAIDCRSWQLALDHEPCARSLTVTGWTAARPGLPYICSRRIPEPLYRRLAAALVAAGALPVAALVRPQHPASQSTTR